MSLPLVLLLAFVASTAAADKYRLVCYYTNWAQYRPGTAKFLPKDVPPDLCTHIIFSFAYLDKNGLMVKREHNDDEMYRKFTDLKKSNPNLKTMLAVGGWTHPREFFSTAARSPASRQALAKSVVQVLRKYEFDGYDLDWEYPGSRGSPASDKKNFTDMVQDLRTYFDKEAKTSNKPRLLLSAAVAAGKEKIEKAYEIEKIAKHLDFINLMSYDLHGAWDKETNSNAPLFPRSTESGLKATLNVQWAAQYWKKRVMAGGQPASIINLGMATYGQSFTLKSASQHGIGAPAPDSGKQAPVTKQAGFMAYMEICKFGGKRVWDDEQKFPYQYKGNQWVSYDDQTSLAEKVKYLKKEGFGGDMFWTLDLDDFKGDRCNQGKYPLIGSVKKALQK